MTDRRRRQGKGWREHSSPAFFRRRTWRLRRLPDFIIIGAQKCGTTTFFANLCRHPSIAPPVKKEIHFFDNLYDRGLPWYRSHFPLTTLSFGKGVARRVSLCGEATPRYLPHPRALRRIRRDVPAARFIVLLRDPVARAYSQYRMNLRRGWEDLSFGEALRREEERCPGKAKLRHGYQKRGRYAEQLQPWLKAFPRDRFLFIKSEEYFRRPEEALQEAWTFLGLGPFRAGNLWRRVPEKYEPMTAGEREHLREHFRGPNEELASLLGPKFQWEDPLGEG